jgi:uncharacterized protein (TIGR02757 family)
MEWLGSDPVQFVHHYPDPLDQEIVGLIAASLAYGNVTSIHRSIADVLGRLGPAPRRFLKEASETDLAAACRGFRHRWTSDVALTGLLSGVRRVVVAAGSLGAAFAEAVDAAGESEDYEAALARWAQRIQGERPRLAKELLAEPGKGSACKRLHLYVRWMVRSDVIDPGCWRSVADPSRLLVPLDTHVYRFARAAGWTRRRTPDAVAVRDITAVLRRFCPADPVRYDFSLTRPGIVEGWQPG